jgi:adenosyl cobinamide kinase/adenosyl cobinamide phosphate guanylyltransferase
MDEAGAWSDEDWYAARARAQVANCIDELVDSWAATTVPLVGVSNETAWHRAGHGIGPPVPDELGWLNQRIAAASDEVVLGWPAGSPPGGM